MKNALSRFLQCNNPDQKNRNQSKPSYRVYQTLEPKKSSNWTYKKMSTKSSIPKDKKSI